MSAFFPAALKTDSRGIGRSAKVDTVWCGRQSAGRVMSLKTFSEADKLRLRLLISNTGPSARFSRLKRSDSLVMSLVEVRRDEVSEVSLSSSGRCERSLGRALLSGSGR